MCGLACLEPALSCQPVAEAPLLGVHVVPHPTRPNEDTYSVCHTSLGWYAAVYDGHGGGDVSSFLASALHAYVEACCSRTCNAASALGQAFASAELAIMDLLTPAGSTGCCALVDDNAITVANLGDSRALLCRTDEVLALTSDHRPARPDERDRILRHGGQILWNEGERVMGVLATTRAFGDRDLKQFGVTAEPEITVTPRSASDEFLILATDGVFNVLSNEEVADVARRIMRRAAEKGAPRAAAIRMAAAAIGKFSRDRNSKDDITVVLLDLASVLATGLPEQTQTCTPATAAAPTQRQSQAAPTECRLPTQCLVQQQAQCPPCVAAGAPQLVRCTITSPLLRLPLPSQAVLPPPPPLLLQEQQQPRLQRTQPSRYSLAQHGFTFDAVSSEGIAAAAALALHSMSVAAPPVATNAVAASALAVTARVEPEVFDAETDTDELLSSQDRSSIKRAVTTGGLVAATAPYPAETCRDTQAEWAAWGNSQHIGCSRSLSETRAGTRSAGSNAAAITTVGLRVVTLGMYRSRSVVAMSSAARCSALETC